MGRGVKTGFTLIEILSAIAIVAVLLAVAIPFVGNYINWSKKTANQTTLATLNFALQDYKTLGGLSNAHTLQGDNTQGKIDAVLSALKNGFTVSGVRRSFFNLGATLDTSKLYVTGQGKAFHFAGYGEGAGLAGEEVPHDIPLAAPTVSISANPSSGNAPLDSTITWSSTDATSASVTFDGNSISTNTSGTYDATSLGSGSYTATIDATGPGGTASDSTVITVSSNAQSSVNISPTSYTVISGDSLTFSASGGNGTGSYVWGGDASGTGSTKTVTFNTAGTRSVTVYKAADSSYSQSNTATATLTVGSGWVVSTLAGSGSAAFADGTGTGASFNNPTGITIDSSDTLYVADRGNSRIRKITPAAVVTTLAGSGSAGFSNGTGAAASFNYLTGICINSSGDLYIADTSNHRIRKLTQAGVVTTFAGSGSNTCLDGTGTAAAFNSPKSVVFDASSNLYVADQDDNRIRKITPAAVVSTIAGSGTAAFADGTGTGASFNLPQGVTIDDSGTLYIGDTYNNRIRKITSDGVVTTIAGSGSAAFANGAGVAASFYFPVGVTIDRSGNILVADISNNRIRKITPAGAVTTIAGNGSAAFADGAGASASFNSPRFIAIDSHGSLYVTDFGNNRIRKISPQ